MADVNPKVMELVESELKKNPDISNQELLEKVKSVDKGIEKLTPRQFNARYPLQVKRTLAPKKGRKKKAAAGGRKKAATGRKKTTRRKPASRPAARKAGGRRGRATATTRAATAGGDKNRDRVRKLLLDLARDVADAQGKADVVDVIAGIDRYVDRVVKAAS